MKTTTILAFALTFIVHAPWVLIAQESRTEAREIPVPETYEAREAISEINVDGDLNEEAWSRAQRIPVAYEYQPGDNVPPPVKTDCLVIYDNRFLYIGFLARDPNPSQIRAHLMDRDSINTFVQDDHVGVLIDPFNDARRAIQLRINPLGIQADAIFGELEGIEDLSWDIIWNSAGKITADGYSVEIAIPFNQIRFPNISGPQTWGFEAFRSYPRSVRHRMSSHFVDRNNSCVLCQQNHLVGFEKITSGHNLEFDPTFTAGRTDTRPDFPDGGFQKGDSNFEPGVTARWGMTTNLALNGTVNPDFSQVEADAAQLDVNTRFALFFPEKRPFFMEGIDFFSTPLDAVFTRTVVDPSWGLKLSGKEGKNGIGVFATRDDVNNILLPSNQESTFSQLDQHVTGSVLRYRRDVGSGSILGVLYAGRESEDYHNRLIGTDGFLRLDASNTVRYQFLHSDTQYPFLFAQIHGQPDGTFGGNGLTAQYNHVTTNWLWNAGYEDLTADFRADSGFIPRVDVRTANGGVTRRIFGNGKSWYTQLNFGANFTRTEDHQGLLTDRNLTFFGNVSGPLQSFVELDVARNQEFFNGTSYDITNYTTTFQMKPTGNLSLQFTADLGDGIDFTNSRAARIKTLTPSIEFKIGRPINVQLDHSYQTIDDEPGRVLTANLSQLRIVYQFNARIFARAIFQYLNVSRDPALYVVPVEPQTRTLFTQLLFSYKLNPQTVLFVGYSDNRLGMQNIDLTQTDRTLFLKVGYAWLF